MRTNGTFRIICRSRTSFASSSRGSRGVVRRGAQSQLVGLPETARRILQGQVRVGRPLGIKGLPEAAKGPAFSAVVGLLVYPQVAHIEYFEPRSGGLFRVREPTATSHGWAVGFATVSKTSNALA